MNRAVILIVGLVVIASFPLLSAEAGGTDVLFDLSKEADTLYGNPELQGDMLCSMLEGEGITYAFTERGRSLALYDLSSYRILVIWDPDGPYDENERTAIISFVEQGGILLFAGTSFYNTPDTIYVNCNELLTTFGITLVREQVLDKTDYIGCHCGTTPLIHTFAEGYFFYDISYVACNHTGRIETVHPAVPIAFGDNDTFVDLNGNEMHDENEMIGSIPVMAMSTYGAGVVVAFGTEKVFERSYFNTKDNGRFALNLFADLLYQYPLDGTPAASNTMRYAVGFASVVIVLVIAGVYRHNRP